MKLVLWALGIAYAISLPVIVLAVSWIIVPEGGLPVTVILLIVLAIGFKPVAYLKRNPIWIHRLSTWIGRDAHSYNRLGYAFLEQHKTAAGLAHLDRAIRMDPILAVAYSNRCIAWCQQQEWEQAIQDAETAIRLDPQLPQAYSNRAVPYIETEQYTSAIADCDRAIEIDTDLSEAYLNRACAYGWLGRNEVALADTTTALRLGLRWQELWGIRWTAMLSLEHYEAVLSEGRKALDSYPNNKQMNYLVATAFAHLHDMEAASTYAAKAVSIDPQYAEAWWMLGTTKPIEEAIPDFTQAIELGIKDSRVFSSRGIAYHFAGDFQRAMEDHDTAIRLDEDRTNVIALNNRGFTLHALGQFEDAATDYEDAISVDLNHPNAYKNYAWQLATCPDAAFRDGSKAVQYATQAHELTDWKMAEWNYILAAAHAEAGDFETASHWQRKAIEEAGKNADDLDHSNRLKLYLAGLPYRE